MNLRLKQLLVFITILIAFIGFTYAAIPNNTLQNDWLVVSNVNATNSYNIGTNTVINNNREATFTNLTLSGDYLNGYNVTEQLRYPHQPASYIIWTDGSTYYAKNNTDNSITTNTDFDSLLGSLCAKGGTIQILDGTYTANTKITVTNYPDFAIIGESWNTIIQTSATFLEIRSNEVKVANLKIDAQGNAIDFIHSYHESHNNLKFDHIWFYDNTGTNSLDIRFASPNLKITNCKFDTVGRVYLGETTSTEGAIIENNVFKAGTYEHQLDIAGSAGTHSKNVKIVHNSFYDPPSGKDCIHVQYCENIDISDNYLENGNAGGGSHTIFVSKSYDVTINGNTGRDVAAEALCIEYGNWRVSITGNIFNSSPAGRIYFFGNPNGDGGYGYTITGNVFAGSNSYCGAIVNIKDFVFSDNIILNSGAEAIKLFGSQDGVIDGNIIVNSSRNTDNTYDDIYIDTDPTTGWHSQNITISNNHILSRFTNNSRYGIYENDVNQTNNWYHHNKFYGQATGAIRVMGITTITRDNWGYLELGDLQLNAGNIEMYNGTAWVIIGP